MKKIILDVDPGHDDAVAIMMAAKSPEIDLLGITVVSGNNSLEKTFKNTLNICSWLDLDVEIAKGMDRPMVRDRYLSSDAKVGNVHGETGLDGHDFGEITVKHDERHAVQFIIDKLMKADEKIIIVPTGPLSNIGMALRLEPSIANQIDQIVLMGGAYGIGNMTPSAEFNILADPEAAHIVFSSGIPIVMMGLDLTRQAYCGDEIVEKMRSLNNKASELFVNLMSFFKQSQKREFGWDSPPIHDPTTIAYLLRPEIFETVDCNVEISLSNNMTYGRTVCDIFGVTNKVKNTKVATKIDYQEFWNLIYNTLKLYS